MVAGKGVSNIHDCRVAEDRRVGDISRILFTTVSVIYLSDQPEAAPATRDRSGQPLGLLFDLAPSGVCRAPDLATKPVVSYTTFSPLPRPRRSGARAVCFLWHFPSLPLNRKVPRYWVAYANRLEAPCPSESGLSSSLLSEEKRPIRPTRRSIINQVVILPAPAYSQMPLRRPSAIFRIAFDRKNRKRPFPVVCLHH
jgi:hypothetical protein